MLLTAVAVNLVQIGLAVTDALCAAVSRRCRTRHRPLHGHGGGRPDPAGAAAGQPALPTFVLFLGGIAVVVGAVLVWIELLLRAAAVYVAVLFLPLALAGLAWPAISHWSRRLADTLAALVLSKFVIVAVLSLAVGALAGGTGSTPSGEPASGGGFASVLGGAALLLLAGLAPWSLFRLLPFLEAGAVGHLEGLSQRARHGAAAPASGLANVALRAAAAGSWPPAPVGVVGARALGVVGGSGRTRVGGPARGRPIRRAAVPAGGGGGGGTPPADRLGPRRATGRSPGSSIPMWKPGTPTRRSPAGDWPIWPPASTPTARRAPDAGPPGGPAGRALRRDGCDRCRPGLTYVGPAAPSVRRGAPRPPRARPPRTGPHRGRPAAGRRRAVSDGSAHGATGPATASLRSSGAG